MSTPRPVRLDQLRRDGGPGGVLWSAPASDLNVNLVDLAPGEEVAAHVNREVDVLVVVLEGTAHLRTGDLVHDLAAGSAVVLRKGVERSVEPGPDGVRYLTVHRARGPLTIAPARVVSE